MKALRIWTNVAIPEEQREAWRARVAPHVIQFSKRGQAQVGVDSPVDPALLEADIVYGQPALEQVTQSSRLRWLEVSSAGYARYDLPELKEHFEERGIILTNSSSVFADSCAQHALALMLMLARDLPRCWENQQKDEPGWPYATTRAHSRLLRGDTVLFFGYGAIARRLTELLAPFKMRFFAVRRKTFSVPGVHVVGEDRLSSVLTEADHVINILPEGEATERYMNARRFACMKPGARFYNIGRGSTVDQQALSEALTSGRLGAACLDVTSPEPLPPDHPLWTTPRCFITPHSAGGFAGEQEALLEHFAMNLKAFAEGSSEELVDRIW